MDVAGDADRVHLLGSSLERSSTKTRTRSRMERGLEVDLEADEPISKMDVDNAAGAGIRPARVDGGMVERQSAVKKVA